MPDVHTAGNVQADRAFADSILRRADGLIAVSENTRQDAIRLLGIAPERIQTIYSGIAERYYAAQPIQRTRPYALCVGTIEPRKNLDALLDAWALLKPSLRAEYDLVIAGPRGWSTDQQFARINRERYLSWLRARSRSSGTHCGRDRVRVSVALRRLRIPGGASDGGRRSGADVEQLLSAGGHWQCGGSEWTRRARPRSLRH